MGSPPNKRVHQHIFEAMAELKRRFDGEIRLDPTSKMLYSTDASIYEMEPFGVVLPKHREDLIALTQIATKYQVPLIPRAAGTSLSGQCVGHGLVVDISKYMNRMLEEDIDARRMWVEPGVIQDHINFHMKPHGLHFGPDTSTSNRAMIGGMIGNNSCGSHSIYYGATVDHVEEMEVVLSDGSTALFTDLSPSQLEEKKQLQNLEGHIYREITRILEEHGSEIEERFPKIVRKNNGYLLDQLLRKDVPFNLSRLICASEGTLTLLTKAKVKLVPSPKQKGLIAAQFSSLHESLVATVEAIDVKPSAVELMDKTVLDLSKNNLTVQHLRFFLEGDPEAVLAIEFYGETREEIECKMDELEARLKKKDLGYTFPRLWDSEMEKLWKLRKAGLGVLYTLPGDAKPVTFVEDTAVAPEKLPEYIREFQEIVEKYDTKCVYYAHASVGELHMRPILNLKDPVDVKKMKDIGDEVAELVIKYGGAISGEHGDGRVRGHYNEMFFGPTLYEVLREVKRAFDPQNIFNPHKIVDVLPMDTDLRYPPGYKTPDIVTALSFEKQNGYVRAAEFCNGAGACRKSHLAKGGMCPSYQATLEEQNSTRGRANVLRQAIAKYGPEDAFQSQELFETMNLCLECKMCKSECPSSVDMAKLKYEYLQLRRDKKGTSLSELAIGFMPWLTALSVPFAFLFNRLTRTTWIRKQMEKWFGIDQRRLVPKICLPTLRIWFRFFRKPHPNAGKNGKTVHFFADPFTNFNEPHVGIAAINVLEAAGFCVQLARIRNDGRTLISKGFTRLAKRLARRNLLQLRQLFENRIPLIGVEPSTLLTLRDEYKDFFPNDQMAASLVDFTFLIDEFMTNEAYRPFFNDLFSSSKQEFLLHGHCFQKALAHPEDTIKMLSLVPGVEAELIASGCCGMAGSFGYDKEKYEMSLDVGNLVLFPAVRDRGAKEVLAVGTSCRHQIQDGAKYQARHPIEVLAAALKERHPTS